MGAKIAEKRCPKTGSIPRGVPGSPQEPPGTILGANLEYLRVRFCVFPRVLYSFHMKINVFPTCCLCFVFVILGSFRNGRLFTFLGNCLETGL